MFSENKISLIITFLLFLSCTQRRHEPGQLSPFEQDSLWGYKDTHGTVVIEPQYYVAHDFSTHGIAAVADGSGWSYIDVKGNVVIKPYLYDNGPDYFQEGLARFTKDNKFGFFDEKGQVQIKPKFDFALPFFEGLAVVGMDCQVIQEGEHNVTSGGKWGFINNKGKLVIPLNFDRAESFEKDKARVILNGRWITINKAGKIIK